MPATCLDVYWAKTYLDVYNRRSGVEILKEAEVPMKPQVPNQAQTHVALTGNPESTGHVDKIALGGLLQSPCGQIIVLLTATCSDSFGRVIAELRKSQRGGVCSSMYGSKRFLGTYRL